MPVVITGSLATIFAADNEVFSDAETTAKGYRSLHFAAATIFELGNAFAFTTNTATLIEGYDPGSQDTMSLTGTNFLGTGGKITHGEFVGDDTGGIIFDGRLNWSQNKGIVNGVMSKIDITAPDGSRMVGEGTFNLHPDGTIAGVYKKQTIYAPSGLITELTGNIDVVKQTGTITKLYVHDGGGNGLTITGALNAKAFFNTFPTAVTLGDVYTFGLSGPNVVTGSAGVDELLGFAGNDRLIGLGGDDTLDGGTGSDSLIGGLGNDIYFVDSVNDRTGEMTGQGHDIVMSTVTYTLGSNVEELILSGGNLNGTGSADDNTITGTAGDNTLNGGAGADTLNGGDGNDTLVVDNAGDIANGGNNTDTVSSSISFSIAPFADVENLLLTGTKAINGTGNAGDNTITGNTAANTLDGGDGLDTLLGMGGADVLTGGLHSDILDGGAGFDTLTGGAAIDTFVFHGAQAGTSTNADTITDFSAGGGGDIIDISDVLVGYAGGTLANFVHLTEVGGNTIISIDKNGAATGGAFYNIVTLTGVTGLVDADTMVANGNLVAL